MRSSLLAVAVLAAASAAPLPAQRPTVDPPPFAWLAGARESGFPFGLPDRRRVRHLQVHDGMAGRPRTIAAVGFRRAPTGTAPVPAFRAEVSLRLSTAATTAAAIDARFAANHGPDLATALPRRSVSFPSSPGVATYPAPFEYRLPVDLPFAFAGQGPLCIDLTVHDHTNGVAAPFDLHAEGYAQLGPIGPGCDGLSLTTGLSYQTVTHEVRGAPGLGPVVVLIGAAFDAVFGTPLPLDLGPLGATGCALHLEPALGLAGFADAAGTFTTTVPVGAAPPGAHYGAQAVAVQPGLNPLGAITSNAEIVVPYTGRVVGRVWTEDLSAAEGLRQPVFGLVVEIR
jgi:hypothetical protein